MLKVAQDHGIEVPKVKVPEPPKDEKAAEVELPQPPKEEKDDEKEDEKAKEATEEKTQEPAPAIEEASRTLSYCCSHIFEIGRPKG